jgi:prepilin-type N-terminal cleavage/methylation domain-containing protein
LGGLCFAKEALTPLGKSLLKHKTSDRIVGMFKRKNRRGVSLAELLVAMAVIAIGMSGVAASLYFGHQKSQHGDKIATATNHARTLIELAVGRNYNDGGTIVPLDGVGLPTADSGLNDAAADSPRALAAAPFTENDFLPVAEAGEVNPRSYLEDFQRKIQITRIGAAGTPDEFLQRMTVTIYWEEKGGRHNVSLAAIIPTTRPIAGP